MTDKQQPILVLGKEYVPNPATPRRCDGCVGVDNNELCEALPSCRGIIFVERKLEVSVLCDQARTYGPATSHKAAQGMGRKAGRIADLILVELRDANLTGSMLAARTGVALNSITPRFAQLFRKGLIHAAGGSGRETVWAIGNGIHVAPRPDTPDSHWCVGCTPDNCAGCDGSAASNVSTA